MKVSPQTFFNFYTMHVPLLRALQEQVGELSEVDARRLIRDSGKADDELPETTWRRLRELQVLVPTEPGSDFYFLAEPVRRLLDYLLDEAKAATPEIIRGYIQSLEALGKQLVRAIDTDELTVVRLALEEIQQTLRRIYADLDETHHAIMAEVARYKTERKTVSVRDKFRRIVHWMERYVDPMVDIVRTDGSMRATFDETERLLNRARDHGLFNDLPALERNLRQLRLVQRHSLRVFQQCRRELQPLYESLRRSSFIAEGAAVALECLRSEGPDGWSERHAIGAYTLRWLHVPADNAIERALRNVVEHPPEPAPVLAMSGEDAIPAAYLRRLWLEALPDDVRIALPVQDLLGWVVYRYPQKNTDDVLSGFSRLVFHDEFSAKFTDGVSRTHETTDGTLDAQPVELASA